MNTPYTTGSLIPEGGEERYKEFGVEWNERRQRSPQQTLTIIIRRIHRIVDSWKRLSA